MQTVVPAIVTPIGEGAASTLLVGELTRKMGKPPPREMATLLFALIWTETARGRPTCHNMGNISAGDSYPTIWRPPWFDLEQVQAIKDPAQRQKMLGLHAGMIANPPTVPKAFRAYQSDAEGMRDYVDQLFRTFPEVISAAESGSPDKFVAALHQKYSRDYGPDSIRTFASFQKGFGERELFAALPKADGTPGAAPSFSPSHSERVPWPSVLERVRDVPIISMGSQSFYVALWCRLLNIAMGTDLQIVPHFDHGVDEVTRAFQEEMKKAKKYKGNIDGIVGPQSWAAMLEMDMTVHS